MEEEERGLGGSLFPKAQHHEPLRFSLLSFICFDQSNLARLCLSWSIFFLMAVGVPLVSQFLILCSDCDYPHHRPYGAVVQLSLSTFAAVSFFSLSSWSHKYGIRKLLFLDKLRDLSDKVRHAYELEIQRSKKLLSILVLPPFILVTIYRFWWYATAFDDIPHVINPILSHTIACTLQLTSWLYRTSIFIIVCILYQLTGHLQILRLEEFAECYGKEITDVGMILKEHLKIRRNLRIVSHRFRRFILLSLVLGTASQFMALLMIMRASVPVNAYEAGELALCSLSLVTGLFICLRSATKITHKAQSVGSLAAKWHVCATVDCIQDLGRETTRLLVNTSPFFLESDEDRETEGEHDLDNAKMIMPIYARSISYQKRQALVKYLENNRAGITVYGFTVDRTWLRTIFGVELALFLWLLKKTIVNIA